MAYKLLIIREEAKRKELDSTFPFDWRVMFVGQKIEPGIQGPFELIVVACEMYTPKDWQWYHAVVKYLRSNDRAPLWTN